MEKKVKIAMALLRLMPKMFAVFNAQKHGTDDEQDAAVAALVGGFADEYCKLYPGHEEYVESAKELILAVYEALDGD